VSKLPHFPFLPTASSPQEKKNLYIIWINIDMDSLNSFTITRILYPSLYHSFQSTAKLQTIKYQI
jgi:hypothetical protein